MKLAVSRVVRAPDERICVVGLGYVGIPAAARLAQVGFRVTGLDLDDGRASAVREGRYPMAGNEPGLAELIERVVKEGRLTATTDAAGALGSSDVAILCVQTPFDVSRVEPQYAALRSALATVAAHLRRGMMVVVESTIAPTTMQHLVRPTLEDASGLRAGVDFDLVHCPERVMPGKLLKNLTTLPRAIGGITPASAERAKAIYDLVAPVPHDLTDMVSAEIAKTAENAYRDVQIAFANELARICEELGVDAYRIRELINRSPERNVHIPGAGVGGHCIPKDTWLLAYGTKGRFTPELMLAARRRNEDMPLHTAAGALEALRSAGRDPEGARIVVLGAAYLQNTDDTRHTPAAPIVEALVKAGAEVRLHDPFVHGSVGGVRAEAGSVEELAGGADALVLVTAHDAYRALDLRRLANAMRTPVLVDGRNAWRAEDAREAGLRYWGVGKGRP